MARDDHDILSFGVADTVRYFRLGDAVRPDLCKVSVNTISARVATHISDNGLDTEADLEKALLHANVSPDHGQCELKRSCDEEDIKSLAGTMSHSDDEDFVSRLMCVRNTFRPRIHADLLPAACLLTVLLLHSILPKMHCGYYL